MVLAALKRDVVLTPALPCRIISGESYPFHRKMGHTKMNNKHRRVSGIVGMAAGALLAPPLLALLASPLANADPTDALSVGGGDITTLGPYTIDGITDSFSFNNETFGAFDNFAVDDGVDVDAFYGGTDTYGFVLTDPGVGQIGYVDIDGTPDFVATLDPADFLTGSPDVGLTEIAGGAVSAAADNLFSSLFSL